MKDSFNPTPGNGGPGDSNGGPPGGPQAKYPWWQRIFFHVIEIIIANFLFEIMMTQFHSGIQML